MDKKEANIKGTPLLKDAILDAERLLAHASEYGIKIEQKHIKSIIGAKRNNQLNEWNEQDEIDFWLAFQILSNAVQPVSIDSLRAASVTPEEKRGWWSKKVRKKGRSLVQKTVSFYRKFALISMIVMLAIQIYALIGTAQLAKINAGDERMLEIEKRMQALVLITSSNPDDRTAKMEQTNLEMEIGELSGEVETGIHLMNDWLNFTYSVWSKSARELSHAIMHTEFDPNADETLPFEDGAHQSSENIVVVQQAKSLIIILNQYILPLLYGLLGGIAFVLRSLASETKLMTYTATSNIKFGLRIHLGALAGLVIGFLWGDIQGKSFGIAESLSPLAVAFLAGYSVEFLFRMLDSVIGTTNKKAVAITGADSEKEKK